MSDVVVTPDLVVTPKEGMVVTDRSKDRHKDREARLEYMRKYMRKRRAKVG